MMAPVECVVCGARQSKPEPGWPGLRRCVRCGHGVADLNVDQLDVRQIYDATYFTDGEYLGYLRDAAVFRRQFRERVTLLRRYQPSGRLIEVGCAYGLFLAVAREHFEVTGFDVAEEPVLYARSQLGLDARCEDFAASPLASESADVVVMWDTIEHLQRPDLAIAKAARVLRPDGYLFLTTGDVDSVLARVQRRRWRLFHPPTHLHYFSRRSLSRLLERHGLKTVRVSYEGVRRSVGQTLYSLLGSERGPARSARRRLIDSRLGRISFAVNTFDIMLVVARKGG